MTSTLAGAMAQVLPIIFLIATGLGLQKVRSVTPDMAAGLKRTVTHLALPALLLLTFSGTTFTASYLLIIGAVFLTCAAMVALGSLVGRHLGIPSPYFALLMGGFEAGMLGYSLFLTAYGSLYLDRFAIVDLGQVLFVFFVLVTLLTRLKAGTHSAASAVKQFVTSPVIIAIFLGLLNSALKPHFTYDSTALYQALAGYLSLLGGVTVPAISLVIGYELKISVGDLLLPLKTLAIRYLLLAGFAAAIHHLLLSNFFADDPLLVRALYVMFVLPPPFVMPLFMADDDLENKRYVLNTLSLGTVIALAFFLVVISV